MRRTSENEIARKNNSLGRGPPGTGEAGIARSRAFERRQGGWRRKLPRTQGTMVLGTAASKRRQRPRGRTLQMSLATRGARSGSPASKLHRRCRNSGSEGQVGTGKVDRGGRGGPVGQGSRAIREAGDKPGGKPPPALWARAAKHGRSGVPQEPSAAGKPGRQGSRADAGTAKAWPLGRGKRFSGRRGRRKRGIRGRDFARIDPISDRSDPHTSPKKPTSGGLGRADQPQLGRPAQCGRSCRSRKAE